MLRTGQPWSLNISLALTPPHSNPQKACGQTFESAFKGKLSDLILSIIVVRMSDGQVNRDCEEHCERPPHMHGGRKQSLCPVRQMEEFSPVGLNIGSRAPVSRSLASLERTQSTGKQRLFTFPWRRRSTASHLNQQALRIGQAQARWLRLI